MSLPHGYPSAMPTIDIRYRWRYWDEVRRKHCTTRFHCTEEFIRKEHPDAVAVENSRQELVLVDDPYANSTAHFFTGPPDNEPMCGRYALNATSQQLMDHFQLVKSIDFPARFNIAPTSMVPVIRQSPEGERVAGLLKWGLVPNWSQDSTMGAKLNNARAETVAEKPSFRDAFMRRRCLVPATGFYEWKTDGKAKQPYFIHYKSGELMAMAGLWESWRAPSGEILRTFCVITTRPNSVMEPIHDRMPVLIHPGNFAAWLDPEIPGVELSALLEPMSSQGLEAWAVSKAVSRASEDHERLISPIDN